MLTVWRIVTDRFVEGAFSGEGARRFGSHWTRKGVPLVYTAGSQSPTMLERRVRDEPPRANSCVIPAKIPTELEIGQLTLERLPPDWRNPGHLETPRAPGTEWAAGLGTAVLAVPSAVIPAETNSLLNPRHPDFARIAIGLAEEQVTDLGLIKKTPPTG
jgi:RES domain-containing protein